MESDQIRKKSRDLRKKGIEYEFGENVEDIKRLQERKN